MSDDVPPADPTDTAADATTGPVTDDTIDGPVDATVVDLDRIVADLDGVEAALARLDAGTYWTDEVTGEPLADDVLRDDPVVRRNPAPDTTGA